MTKSFTGCAQKAKPYLTGDIYADLMARASTNRAAGLSSHEAGAKAARNILAQIQEEIDERQAANEPKVKESRARDVTKTKAFRDWFGDSKVVDADGKPLVVYHGTKADFSAFNTDDELGSHFGTAEQANTVLSFWIDYKGKPAGTHVIPAYLSIKNPLRLRDVGSFRQAAVVPQLVELGILPASATAGMYSGENGLAAMKRAIEQAGYDGAVYANTREGEGDSWIAFRPEQIKSAIGNDGTFDPKSADITRSAARAGVNDLDTTESDGVLRINNLEVDYDLRGEGIGRSAIQDLIRDARDRGVLRIELDSRHDAEEFWSKMGFRQDGDGDEDSIPMVMDLQAKSSTARPVFYSQLELAISEVPERLSTMSAKQWQLWLDANAPKMGVKKEEIEWSGIKDYLAMRGKDKVTSEELAAYLRDNGVKVKDVVLGEIDDGEVQAWWNDEGGANEETPWSELTPQEEREARERFREEVGNYAEVGATKFQQYTIPGGENYREVLITLPDPEPDFTIDDFIDEMAAKYGREKVYDTEGFTHTVKSNFPEMLSREDQDRWADIKVKGRKERQRFYVRAHWGDTADVLAHIRVDDRVDADGKRVLFINEIQSDWAQQGRKLGFSTGNRDWKKIADMREELEKLFDQQHEIAVELATDQGNPELLAKREALASEVESIEAKIRNEVKVEDGLPRAPFVEDTKSWVSLALKRAIMMAARDGYDKVAFVTGEQAAEFFNISKTVKSIDWRIHNGMDDVEYRDVKIELQTESDIDMYVDMTGQVVKVQSDDHDSFVGRKLEDIIGKDIAKQILERRVGRLAGDGLKVGGEGMRAFYDKIVPQVANDVLKKIGGGKVGTVTVIEQNKDGYRLDPDMDEFGNYIDRGLQQERVQPGFDITPAMRERLEDGMPLFSTARAARELDVGFGYKVADFLDSSKKVSWWDKTVGTPYHLAQKHPTFKRLYDSIQKFISDVSKYATRAADLAPNILPKLENLKDVFKSPLAPEDLTALSDPIFKGTLVYTRDADGNPVEAETVGEAGVVWTNEELISMWKLNERQRGLYREFRKAANKSIADLAITGMVRLAGEDGEGVRGRVLGASTIQAAADILADHLSWLAANDPKRANTLQNTARIVKEQANAARGLIAKGYAPLSRYGDYTVYAPGIGEHGYFEMFENERDANRRARELREEFPDQKITVGTMSKEGYKLFKGVTPETLALFGESLGLEESASDQQSQVFQEYLKMAKSTRSAMKRLIHRKGVAGFSNDVGRVLAGFVYSNSRQAATNLNAGEMLKSANEIPEGDLKDHGIRLLEYAQNPQEEAQAIRGMLFAQYIGGNVASAVTNLTQSLTTTWPTLSMHFGIGKAGRAMGDALKIHSSGTDDADLKAAIKRAEEEGVTAPQETHQLMAQSQGKGSLKSGDGTPIGNTLAKMSNTWEKALFSWGKMFGWAEVVNREIAFVAAYKLSAARGDANPYEFAKKIVVETQFQYNKGNNPVWARGPVGATLFTFRKFMISYLENLARMYGNGPEGKKAFALSLGILFLLAGTGGFPFADDLDDIIDGFAQRVLNKSWSTKQAKKEFFAGILGEAGADFVEKGFSGLPGVPIDMSGRLGLGNIVPGSGILQKKTSYGRDLAEIVGAAGDFGSRVATGAAAVAQGEIFAGAQAAAPIALANAYKGLEMASLGYYKDAKNRKVIDVTASEAIMKALGFQPSSVDRIQDATRIQQSLIAQNKIREMEIADKWARGRYEKKPALVEEAKRELEEWNAANPKTPIKIDASQINARVKKALQTKAQRLSATAPKEIRKNVSKELRAAEE